MAHLSFSRMTAEEARVVLGWRWPDVAALYEPDLSRMEEEVEWLLTPEYHYHAVRDGGGELIGFCCFGDDAQVVGGDYALDALDVGLGLRPDLVGRGLAQEFLGEVMAFGVAQFAATSVRATVAADNQRSLRMFLRAGFEETQRFHSEDDPPIEFAILVRRAVP